MTPGHRHSAFAKRLAQSSPAAVFVGDVESARSRPAKASSFHTGTPTRTPCQAFCVQELREVDAGQLGRGRGREIIFIHAGHGAQQHGHIRHRAPHRAGHILEGQQRDHVIGADQTLWSV